MIAGNNVYAPIAGNQSFGVVTDLGLEKSLTLAENPVVPENSNSILTITLSRANHADGGVALVIPPGVLASKKTVIFVNSTTNAATATCAVSFAGNTQSDLEAFLNALFSTPFSEPQDGNQYEMVVINQMAAGGPSINISLGPGGGGLAVADYTAGSIAKFIFTAIQTSSATPTMTMIPLGPYGGIGSANWVSAFVYGSITTALTSGPWDASTGSRIPAGSLVGSFNYYSPLQVMIFANALGTAQSADGPLPTITDILNQFSNVQVGIPVIVKMICTVKTGIFTWTTYTDAGTTGTVSINDQLITTGPAATSPAGQPANTVYELQLVIVPAGTKATSWSGSDMVIGWVPLSHNVP